MLKLSKCIRELCIILITIWLLLTLPVTAVLFLPFYVWRWIVLKLSRLLRPDLDALVSAMSAFFATDTIYTCPRINIAVNLTLETSKMKTTKAVIVDLIWTEWIQSRKEDGKLIFPQFQQFVTTWMGFSFWKWEEDFKIENHVYSIETTSMGPDEYLNKPFTNGQSPWELLIFETPETGVFQVTIRFHHVLADGYSIFKAISQLSSTPQLAFYQPTKLRQNSINHPWNYILRFLKGLSFPVLSIYEMVKDEMEPMEKCALDPPTESETVFAISTGPISSKIPLTAIREIKDKFGVSSTTCILAAVAGGIRKFLLENGHTLPKYIRTSLPVLTQSRKSNKLTNKFSNVVFKLPVGEEAAVKRVQLIEAGFQEGKRSTVPITTYFIVTLLGALPNCMVRKVFERPWPPYVISAIVGPQEVTYYKNTDFAVREVNYTMACHKVGVLVNICSYNQNLQMSLSANKTILPDNADVEQLQNWITQELVMLQGLSHPMTTFKEV